MARKTTKRRKSQDAQPAAPKPTNRRDTLKTLALFGAGAAVLGGGGTALALDFRKKLAETDLSRIGNGMATIVQIHDPQCALCTALQKATRKALRQCKDAAQTQYLVANITTLEGAEFQARMGLPNVTLVFLDGAGKHVHTIQGVTPADEIKREIQERFA
ncbi:hypothetical protein [Primorskyibacter sp. S187A]|uniref:hypothetical protein n=1 Tax=Primorskyibacter sp. S187A TaxID=3415130 RepID=UPI003C7D4BB5